MRIIVDTLEAQVAKLEDEKEKLLLQIDGNKLEEDALRVKRVEDYYADVL